MKGSWLKHTVMTLLFSIFLTEKCNRSIFPRSFYKRIVTNVAKQPLVRIGPFKSILQNWGIMASRRAGKSVFEVDCFKYIHILICTNQKHTQSWFAMLSKKKRQILSEKNKFVLCRPDTTQSLEFLTLPYFSEIFV